MERDGTTYEKIAFIDILKSIACLCVLIGHVINGMLKDGIEVSTVLYEINTYVYLFHVPCFFFASGYLYANKQLNTCGQYLKFVIKKLIVLGLPYFICSIAYVLLSSIMSSEMHTAYSLDMIRGGVLFITPVAQYWYLYALFEMFLVVPVIEYILRRFNKLCILLFLLLCALYIHTNISYINYLVSYTCFFYMGAYFNYSNIIKNNFIMRGDSYRLFGFCCVLSIVIYLSYRLIEISGAVESDTVNILYGITRLLLVIIIVGMSFSIAGMDNLLHKFLVYLSQYSFYIYLFHTWFSGTLRVLMRKAGCENGLIQVVCGFAIGLAGSMGAAMIIKKVPLFRFWFEPLKVVRCKYNKRKITSCRNIP